MNKLALISLALMTVVSVASADGLSNTMASLYEELLTNARYTTSLDDENVSIVDPTSGRKLIDITQVSATQVTLSGVVAQVPGASAAARDEIRSHIADYNVSAVVGTLYYNEATGLVTIQHHLNPVYVKAAPMAKVAALVADAVRNEAREIAGSNALATTMSSLYDELQANTRYSVLLENENVTLVDPEDGAKLVNIMLVSATQVTVKGVIAQVSNENATAREEIRSRVSEYNVNAAVGTLTYDEATGLVTIQHHLNPVYVKPAVMANVALRVADAARSEARSIAAMQEKIRVAQCATNEELCHN